MSSAEQQVQRPPSASLSMILVLSSIAMLSGFLVVLVSQLTAPLIAENQRLAIERALVQVIPGSVAHQEFYFKDGGLLPVDEFAAGESVYAGYDADGKLLGIAARAASQGYAGMIYLLYGYDPACECIRGIQVLKMAETPGLGDKIIKDANFRANFDALDAQVDMNKMALVNPIVTVKHGTKQHPWEIDAISGATISAKAVGKALNQSAQSLLPKLLPIMQQLREEAPK